MTIDNNQPFFYSNVEYILIDHHEEGSIMTTRTIGNGKRQEGDLYCYGQCSINMVLNYYWWIATKPNTYVKAAETPGGGEYIYNEIEAIS